MDAIINAEKQILVDRIDKLIYDLGEKEKELSVLFLLIWLKNTNARMDELISKSLDLQNEILLFEGNSQGLYQYKKIVVEYERMGFKLQSRLGFFPKIIISYLVFLLLFWITIQVNIPNFIVKNLGVQAPEKLISLGIAGAFLYLATEFLSYQEKLWNQQIKIATFLVRLSLAIIVPIVLVILFFNEKGEIKKLALSPEILSFGCGYSAKLVIGIFNKIVEKGTKMIEAI